MEAVCLLLHTPRQNIVRLCSLIEGYEGIAVLRTVNAAQGLLELLVAPDFHDTARSLLHALAHDIDLHMIDPCEVL
jgi:hypothetical protein